MTAVLEPTASDLDSLVSIAVGDIHPSPANPRRSVEDIDELAASIATLGIVEPLIVTPAADGGYDLVAGHRRLAASRKAGLDAVPCVVRQDLDERSAAELRLVENLHRQDLSAMEEAAAYKGLIALGYSQRELAKQIGRSQAHISRRLGLLLLPAPAQEALDSGRITIEQATALARMHDEPERIERVLEAPRSVPTDNYLRHQLTEYTNAKTRAKVVAELEAKGVRIQDGYSGRQRLNFGDVGVTVDEEAHAAEPCHAVTVAADGRIDVICTDRDRHGPDGASKLKASNMAKQERPQVEVRSQSGPAGERRLVDPKVQAEAAAAQERATARAEAAAARAEHVRDLIISPLGGGTGMIRLFVEMWLVTVDAAPPVLAACALLGYDGVHTEESAADQLRLHADPRESDQKPRARWQAALALAVATGEESLRIGNYMDRLTDEDARTGRSYLNWLAETGYQLTNVERDLVAAPLPEPPAEPRPDDGVAWYDDPEEGPRWVDESEADVISGQDPNRLHVLSPAELEGSATADEAVEPPTITVKKSGKRWKVSCSACGDVGHNTTEEYGNEAGALHLAGHGSVVEVSA